MDWKEENQIISWLKSLPNKYDPINKKKCCAYVSET